jgi:hypothetical protein
VIVAGCSRRGACPQPKRDTELSVVVLTSGFWPATTAEPAQLPADVQKVALPAAAPWPAGPHPLYGPQVADGYAQFYTAKYQGRLLHWAMQQGTAELRCWFAAGRKELVVHTFQAGRWRAPHTRTVPSALVPRGRCAF